MTANPGTNHYWSSDVRVSMPEPTEHARGVPMSGFVFTAGGLAHDITKADFVVLSTPNFHPGDSFADLVYEDVDLDQPPSMILGVY